MSKLGRHADAVADWDRAVELDGGPNRKRWGLRRAISLAKSGDHSRAAAEAIELAQAAGLTAADNFELARALALALAPVYQDNRLSRAEQERLANGHAIRSVELLARAAKGGYFKSAGQLRQLKEDADFESLRGRDDF